jgi:quinoprotein glucose dehydrogenase
MRILILVLLAGLAAAAQRPAFAQNQDWPAFGNDPGGSQFSSLDQITAANVGKLKVAWTHRSGDVGLPGSPTGPTNFESVPIVVNGTLYTCTSFGRVFALDPATGKEKWVFDPYTAPKGEKPLYEHVRKAGTCRGVTYWQAAAPAPGAACEKRIFKPDGYGNVYAIDADTGKSCTDFGAAKGHPGYVTHRDYENHGEGAYGMGSPPVVVGDVVVVTISANDGVQKANDGMVRGFDVRSGEMKWEFDPIPPEHVDDTGAANVWSTMSADPGRGLVFLPTTSPSTDYYGGNRKFEMPLTQATVAVDAATGAVKWSYQIVHHDIFDYDLVGHPLLVTIKKDGRDIPVAIQQTKMGFLYVFDRDTGMPIYPIVEKPVPQSDLPEEQSSPTQPMPEGIAPFSRQVLTREQMFGLTPLDRAWCRRAFDKMRYDGMYTPPSDKGSLLFPSALGGGNWGGAAFDATSNTLIIKAENLATRLALKKKTSDADDTALPVVDYLTRPLKGTPYRAVGEVFLSPIGVPCTPPPWGTVTAIDMGTGKVKWQVPLAQAHRYGVTVPASFGWGSPNIGGPIVTAGGLVFIAAGLDAKLRALEAATGRELWVHDLPFPGMSVPVTYMVNGRQYVVISAGGNNRAETRLGDATVAFALDDGK